MFRCPKCLNLVFKATDRWYDRCDSCKVTISPDRTDIYYKIVIVEYVGWFQPVLGLQVRRIRN